MIIKEYRIILPMTVEEYQVGQLWSIAEISRNETGGGDGVEVLMNEPFTNHPLLEKEYSSGQYTKKKYYFRKKVSGFIRTMAPKNALILDEEAWNAYPYCKTILRDAYFGDNFLVTIDSFHLPGRGELENVHRLSPEKLSKREVVFIDIGESAETTSLSPEEDPIKFKSKKTGRPCLKHGWSKNSEPVMTCYKLVTVHFKKFGLQSLVENKIQTYEKRIFTKFHRQVYLWIDSWYGLTMQDIRKLEDKTCQQLQEQISTQDVRGETIND